MRLDHHRPARQRHRERLGRFSHRVVHHGDVAAIGRPPGCAHRNRERPARRPLVEPRGRRARHDCVAHLHEAGCRRPRRAAPMRCARSKSACAPGSRPLARAGSAGPEHSRTKSPENNPKSLSSEHWFLTYHQEQSHSRLGQACPLLNASGISSSHHRRSTEVGKPPPLMTDRPHAGESPPHSRYVPKMTRCARSPEYEIDTQRAVCPRQSV